MPVSTYSGLVSAIADTLNRSDIASAIPDFVRLAEAQMDRRIRVRKQTIRATATISSEFVTVPNNFAGVRTFSLESTPPTTLEYLSPDELDRKKNGQYWPSGLPKFYSVVGDEFQFLPAADGPYVADLTYWLRIPQLSPDNEINWVITNHPDVYLYGSLLQSAPYLKDDARLGMWAELFTAAIDDINSDNAKTPGPMARRGRVF